MIVDRLKALGLHRLDLLCGFVVYELGEASLQYAPTLLMGLQSMARAPALRWREVELDNLRRACGGLSTGAALKAAAIRYNDSTLTAGHQRLFRIDERTLKIKPLFDLVSNELREALAALKEPYVPGPHGMKLAKPERPLSIHLNFGGESRNYPIQFLPATLPAPTPHDTTGPRRTEISVSWAEMLQEASEMDSIDESLQIARRGNWRQRLEAVALHSINQQGEFHVEDRLSLSGLQHLIGLPGAGKTTLLMCLLRHLGIRNTKVAVFFPSIEVCRQYLDELQKYGVNAGLLVGQSRETRTRHAEKLAESLASEDPLRGFGVTSPSAPLFEGVCALASLTSAPAQAMSVNDSFCTSVLEAAPDSAESDKPKPPQPRLCPAWSLCGMTRAAARLPKASVWLGHIRSADTRVPRHVTDLDERYFELIARTFDLVVFDEADKAQADLDRGGIAQLNLSGHDDSFHRQIQRSTLQPIAAGRNAALHGMEYAQLVMEVAEFEKLNVTLTHAIMRLSEPLRRDFAGLLMSPLRIIGDWLSPKQVSQLSADALGEDPQAKAKNALCLLWEGSAIRAFQLRGMRARTSAASADESARIAAALNQPVETVAALQESLTQLMSDWLAESSMRELAKITEAISELLKTVRRVGTDAEAHQLIGLLLPVTFTILSYRRLAPRLNDMVAEGLLDAVRIDELVSKALLMASPDNILGSLSGVRFSTSAAQQEGSPKAIDLQLQYVVFQGAPRLLMYRLHEWVKHDDGSRSGPGVLLTSATSYLPPSPASHIAVTPSYVLRRIRPEGTLHALEEAPRQKTHYAFRPIRDRQGPDATLLRFSGERSEAVRMANLEKMVLHLLDGGINASVLAKDCASFDVRAGIARRAALVVNSYDQARHLKQYIDQRLPAWRDHVVAVVDKLPTAAGQPGYVTASKVESLGDDDSWKVLIFPPGALGRGTNLVFTSGPRNRDAVLGTLYFLTRPHPPPNDLSLALSLAAEGTLDFDQSIQEGQSLEELGKQLTAARGKAYGRIGRLMRKPLYARTLGDLFEPFTANMAVELMQTIGRAMRNGCPVQCFFVDRAWAEKAAIGQPDTKNTSMLVQWRMLLEKGVNSKDRREAALYDALYMAFLDPLKNVDGLEPVDAPSEADEEPWDDNPLWVADQPFQMEEPR